MNVFLNHGSFPYLDDHLLAIDESSDELALIEEAAEVLFGYPISSIPRDRHSHLKLERNRLVITRVDLALLTAGLPVRTGLGRSSLPKLQYK